MHAEANEAGETPLCPAFREGKTEVVNAMLAAPGITVNQADKDGETPLFWASYGGKTEAVKALLTSLEQVRGRR